jgi:hypothetical protein
MVVVGCSALLTSAAKKSKRDADGHAPRRLSYEELRHLQRSYAQIASVINAQRPNLLIRIYFMRYAISSPWPGTPDDRVSPRRKKPPCLVPVAGGKHPHGDGIVD